MKQTIYAILLLIASIGSLAAPPAEPQESPAVGRLTYEYLFLAEALMRHERYAEARTELSGLLKRVKGNDYESALVLQTWAYAEIADGRYPAAAKRLAQALAYGALPAKVAHPLRFTLAQLYAQQERYTEAAKQLKRWFASENKADAKAHVLAAQVYAALKHYKTAIRHARAALAAAKPANESHYRLLLSLYLQAGHWENAASLLQGDILRQYPQKREYWRQLASIQMQRKQESRAASTLSLAYRQGLLEPADIRQLAQLYLYLEMPHKAATLLQQAMQSRQLRRSASHQRLLAMAWQAAREPQAAVAAYRQAGESDDLLRAGELLIDLEQWFEASEILRRAIKTGKSSTQGRAHLLLGISELRLQRFDNAAGAFQRALQQSANDKERRQAQQWLDYLAETG